MLAVDPISLNRLDDVNQLVKTASVVSRHDTKPTVIIHDQRRQLLTVDQATLGEVAMKSFQPNLTKAVK